MRVELGWHANPGLIGPTGAPVRGTRLAELHRPAESLRERRCGRRRGARAGALQAACLSGTTIDAIAEFLLGCADLGQEPDRIDILLRIDGITFDEAWANRIEGKIDDEVSASVISRDDLIRKKLASGREQDLLDVKKLRALSGDKPK